jgi:hypothetical protein
VRRKEQQKRAAERDAFLWGDRTAAAAEDESQQVAEAEAEEGRMPTKGEGAGDAIEAEEPSGENGANWGGEPESR